MMVLLADSVGAAKTVAGIVPSVVWMFVFIFGATALTTLLGIARFGRSRKALVHIEPKYLNALVFSFLLEIVGIVVGFGAVLFDARAQVPGPAPSIELFPSVQAQLAQSAMNEPSGLTACALEGYTDSQSPFALGVDDEENEVFVICKQGNALGIVRALPLALEGEPEGMLAVRDLESITWDGSETYYAAGSHRSLSAGEVGTRKLLRFTVDPEHWTDRDYRILCEPRDVSIPLGAFLETQGVPIDEELWSKKSEACDDWHPWALEIEGLAVSDGKLLCGLKWPLTSEGRAIVVEYDWEKDAFTRSWFLPLDKGRGISELTLDPARHELWVVGNPPAKERDGEPGDVHALMGESVVYVFAWGGETPRVKRKVANMAKELSKLEGLAIVPRPTGGTELWLGYDGPKYALAVADLSLSQ